MMARLTNSDVFWETLTISLKPLLRSTIVIMVPLLFAPITVSHTQWPTCFLTLIWEGRSLQGRLRGIWSHQSRTGLPLSFASSSAGSCAACLLEFCTIKHADKASHGRMATNRQPARGSTSVLASRRLPQPPSTLLGQRSGCHSSTDLDQGWRF